jgi:hypothetical protein
MMIQGFRRTTCHVRGAHLLDEIIRTWRRDIIIGAAVGLSGLNQTTTMLVLAAVVPAAGIQLVCF